MDLERFLDVRLKVVGVTLKTEFLSATSNLRVDQNLVHFGRFSDFSQNVIGVTLKTEVFIGNFQFTCSAKFSAFG